MSYKLYLLSNVRLVSRGQCFFFLFSLNGFKEEKSDDGRWRNENVSQSSPRCKQMARCLVVHNSHAVAACLHPNHKLQHTFSRHTLLFRYFSTFHLAFLHVLNFQFTFCYRRGVAVIHNYVAEEFFWCAKWLWGRRLRWSEAKLAMHNFSSLRLETRHERVSKFFREVS